MAQSLPVAIRDALASAHKKAVEDPKYRAQLKKVGFSLSYVPPEKVHQWINNIYDAYAKMNILGFADADLEGMWAQDENVALEHDRRHAEIERVAAIGAAS